MKYYTSRSIRSYKGRITIGNVWPSENFRIIIWRTCDSKFRGDFFFTFGVSVDYSKGYVTNNVKCRYILLNLYMLQLPKLKMYICVIIFIWSLYKNGLHMTSLTAILKTKTKNKCTLLHTSTRARFIKGSGQLKGSIPWYTAGRNLFYVVNNFHPQKSPHFFFQGFPFFESI